MKKVFLFLMLMFIILKGYTQLIEKTINQNGSGPDNFTTISDAVNWLNNSYTGIGGVNFYIIGNQTFIEDIPNITFQGTESNKASFICIDKNTVIKKLTNSTNYDAIITLEGADYIAFSGLTFSDEYQIVAECGITINNASATNNGCNHNTIKECTIILNHSNLNNTYGIYQTVNGTPTAASASNNYNSYQGNYIVRIKNCGIFLNGNKNFPDQGNTITSYENNHTIIGESGGSNSGYGIYASEQKDLNISKTIVRNIISNDFPAGIMLENLTGSNSVENCQVYNVICALFTPTSQIAYGMNFNLPYTCQLNVSNNMISKISHDISSESAGLWVRGIGLTSSNPYTMANFRFNSIYINEDKNQSTACYAVPNVPLSGIISCSNNIFANNSSNGSTSSSYGLYFGNTANGYGAEYNDIWVQNTGINSYIGRINGVNYQTLNDFKTITNQEDYSISVKPVFISNTDLHLDVNNNSELSNKGGPLTNNYYDYDGDLRNKSACDIGFDEFDSSTDIKNYNFENDFKIYPNPATNNITIEKENFINSYLEIYSITGQLAKSLALKNNITQLDLSNFEKGIYIIKILNENKIVTKKIIKE